MSAPAAIGLMQMGLGFLQADSANAMSAYQERILNFNAQLQERTADLIIEKGKKDAADMRKQGDLLLGRQRVGFAGQGVDVNSGSAAAIQEETLVMAAEDARTIESNAFLEALNVKYQAADTRNQARMTRIAGKAKADQSLVNAGLGGALTYAQMKGAK